MAQIVHLNVGGTRYSTAVSTILKYPDSMLATMIDQQNEQILIQQGKELFIDRNGKIFEYVMDFYRMDHLVVLPEDKIVLMKLDQEADFFGLPALKELVSKKISEMNKTPYFDGVVHLNVGGYRYSLSWERYNRNFVVPAETRRLSWDTYNTNFVVTPETRRDIEAGKEIFIDRDGQIFRHILAYLRDDKKMKLPKENSELEELKAEAEFFGFGELAQMVTTAIDNYNCYKPGNIVRFCEGRWPKHPSKLCKHFAFAPCFGSIDAMKRIQPLENWIGTVFDTEDKCVMVKFSEISVGKQKIENAPEKYCLHVPDELLCRM